MSKLLQSASSSTVQYRRRRDLKGLGKLGSDGKHEFAAPSSGLRVSRKVSFLKLGTQRAACDGDNVYMGTSAEPIEKPSKSMMRRIRVAYERMMVKAASTSGETCVIPVAKASRAPPALSSAVSIYPVWSTLGSGMGTKVSKLDPGFKLTAAEKKYLEHLKRTASS